MQRVMRMQVQHRTHRAPLIGQLHHAVADIARQRIAVQHGKAAIRQPDQPGLRADIQDATQLQIATDGPEALAQIPEALPQIPEALPQISEALPLRSLLSGPPEPKAHGVPDAPWPNLSMVAP